MDDSRLLLESNLAARQPQGATSVIQAITGEGLAQGPYGAARGGVEPMTFRTEGIDNIHLTNHAPYFIVSLSREEEPVTFVPLLNHIFVEWINNGQCSSNRVRVYSKAAAHGRNNYGGTLAGKGEGNSLGGSTLKEEESQGEEGEKSNKKGRNSHSKRSSGCCSGGGIKSGRDASQS